jgi:hypothetical protein
MLNISQDIGVQGMIHTNPSSRYMKTVAPFLERKRALQLDAWGRYPSAESEAVIEPLVAWIDKAAPTSKEQYPTPWATERQITRIINQLWLATCVQDEFASLFKDMTLEDLEECAKSFAFENCLQREGLNRAMEDHASVRDQQTGSSVEEGHAFANLDHVVLENE